MMLKTDDFDYELPQEKIAQTPIINRSDSKMLVLNKNTGDILDKHFYDIVNYFKKGDVLVLNDTKVIPARLIGYKEDTKAVIEILLLKELENNDYEILAKPQRRLKKDSIVIFSDKLKLKVKEIKEDGICIVNLIYEGILLEILDELGQMPLPPYIKEKLKDKNRYQTVYAVNPGSKAAPTAGLHFTNEILKKLEKKGVKILYITLHVGLGTFRPVVVEDVKNHVMHEEDYIVTKEVKDQLLKAKEEKNRIIACGTTTLRCLESFAKNDYKEGYHKTNIFIYEGFKFLVCDALITNFHLPKSTLLMLVSAFSKKEYIFNAYKYALNNDYRFFSFGDCMFITGE